MTRDDKHTDAAAHALDALSDVERAAMERRLAADPALAAEVARHREVAAQLGGATEPVEPPAALRNDILSAIAGLPQETPDAAPGASARDAASSGAVRAGAAERAARRRWFERPAAMIVAAAVAGVLVFSGGALVGAIVADRATTVTASDELASIYAAEDMQRQSVSSDGVAATLVWSPSLGRSALVFDALPKLESGTVYEAWYIGADGAVAAGTFDVRSSGTAWHVLDGTMHAGTTVGVTVEPKGGSTQPTSDPILAIETP
ncbi:Anti-sigma-K factor rskA [Paramicrobacterium humi]|uniref:Regulator of SigK n=1 Tax=Paramicrobacterium humi TaxID=640635 RepID=A0A1H4N7Z8_9MICO|nr:anti-sigma factor [Microbacterium humi]SEB91600.1 Anti-sigma-K factor rskA [Microbacterium humi]